MSEENVEIVQAFLDASRLRDTDTLMAALDPAIEWLPVHDDPDYRVHHGLEDVAAWLAEWSQVFPDMRWEAERIIDAGHDTVVAIVRALGRGDTTGAEVGTPRYSVAFEVRGGRIVRIDEDDADARKAVELEE